MPIRDRPGSVLYIVRSRDVVLILAGMFAKRRIANRSDDEMNTIVWIWASIPASEEQLRIRDGWEHLKMIACRSSPIRPIDVDTALR